MTLPLHTGDRTATVGAEWMVWDNRCRLVVTDPWALYFAREVLERRLAVADRLVNPRRAGSVVRRLLRESGWPVGPREDALFGPQPTDTDPDGIGPFPYALAAVPPGAPVHVPVLHPWQRTLRPAVRRRERDIMHIAPGASAYAWTAQRCAEAVAEATNCGVLVAIGDHVATSGLAPVGGWRLELLDEGAAAIPGELPPQIVALDGGAVSRVSTVRQPRLALSDGRVDLRRIVVPTTGRDVVPAWRSITVAAANGPAASAACRSALLRGTAAATWLDGLGLAAELVAADGTVRRVGCWPARA
ncbi:FAD:protein FMN transferase [Pseudonocardia sp. GCM10023141]|uniref:FAD:protein FMN transferase n=1 Tax=Pseudonocardia sp. GCM10023141 TaxID=3252653 RepID=UPI00361E6FCC